MQEVFAETLDVGVEHYRKIESGVYGLQPEKMLILYEKCKYVIIRICQQLYFSDTLFS